MGTAYISDVQNMFFFFVNEIPYDCGDNSIDGAESQVETIIYIKHFTKYKMAIVPKYSSIPP